MYKTHVGGTKKMPILHVANNQLFIIQERLGLFGSDTEGVQL
jgi:hypothetical protein